MVCEWCSLLSGIMPGGSGYSVICVVRNPPKDSGLVWNSSGVVVCFHAPSSARTQKFRRSCTGFQHLVEHMPISNNWRADPNIICIFRRGWPGSLRALNNFCRRTGAKSKPLLKNNNKLHRRRPQTEGTTPKHSQVHFLRHQQEGRQKEREGRQDGHNDKQEGRQ